MIDAVITEADLAKECADRSIERVHARPRTRWRKYVRWLSQGRDYRVAAHTRFGFAFLEAETLVSAIHLDVFTVLSVARPVDSEVCFGSGSEVTANQSHARFTLESRHRLMSHVIKNRDSRAG